MNTEQIKGNWQIFKGKVREQWGKLTDDDLNIAEGQIEQLEGRIVARYGDSKEEVREKLKSLQRQSAGRHN
jgi:uncharacterized protein YjbJ (UPF0337 family)